MNIRKLLCPLAGFVFGILTLATTSVTAAAPLGQPTGKPILVVSGKITETNKEDTAQFDRAMLEALGMVSFKTTTPWYKEPVTFEGVPLVRIMEAVGATGDRLIAVGLNEYSTEIPMEDVTTYNVIVALKRNGEYMPVRDKGPLFIVYPFDSNPDLKNQKFYSRSVWQLARIQVR